MFANIGGFRFLCICIISIQLINSSKQLNISLAMGKTNDILKKVLKIIGKILLWVVINYALFFVVLFIAIPLNDFQPVRGSSCFFISSLLTLIMFSVIQYRKSMKKIDSMYNMLSLISLCVCLR